MSPWAWICTFIITYWVVVWVWIKGTEPLSNPIFHWLWVAIKIILTGVVGFLFFAFICRGKD